MTDQTDKKKSRHFTVVVRREFPWTAVEVFRSWVDPDIRRRVLSHGRYKNGVKEVDVVEGGFERYEDRWKNRLHSVTLRKYIVIRPSKIIVAHTQQTLEGDTYDQFWATQELLLFKEKGHGCEVVASDQCVSIEPWFVHAAEDRLNETFDLFEKEVFTG